MDKIPFTRRLEQLKNLSVTNWYYAVDYPTTEASKDAYRRVHERATQNKIYVSTRRMDWMNLLHIVLIHGDTTPSEQQQTLLKDALKDGTPLELPDALLEEVGQRRAQQGIGAALAGQQMVERHGVGVSVGQVEFPDAVIDAHLSKVRANHPYFIDYYTALLDFNYSLRLKAPNGREIIQPFQQQLQTADMYQFTPTGRAMHKAVYEGDAEWIAWKLPLWIELDEPLAIATDMPVKAIFVAQVKQEHVLPSVRERPWWNITAIDPFGKHALTMLYDGSERTYDPTVDYKCPDDTCQDYQGDVGYGVAIARTPCPKCFERANAIAMWLHTTVRMIRRDFATSSDPHPFATDEQIIKKKQLVPRQHGKGKPKEKTVEQHRKISLIAYDVSIAEENRTSAIGETSTGEEKRQNWLSLHGADHRIYEKREIAPYEREYTRPHYDRLINQCLSLAHGGEQVKIGDEVYQLVIATSGEVSVKQIVETPQGKYVPMLRPEFKKPMMKRITAKRYKSGTV